MKYMFLLLGILILVFSGSCHNNEESTISEEKAIEIASSNLPDAIVSNADISANLAIDEGSNDTWHVTFHNVTVSKKELGWELGPDVIMSPAEADSYKTVLINIDALTGEILLKNASQGPQLAEPTSNN